MSADTIAWIVASGCATGVGGLAILLLGRPGDRTLDALLGFTAGVMLAAACFSLLVPALERGAVAEVGLGFVAGALALGALDAVLPHMHLRFAEAGAPHGRGSGGPRRRAVLLLAALTIHNVPEGLAVGVAFAAGGTELGVPIALAIGIQNVPEGFAAAAPLVEAGGPRRLAAGVAALTGLVEPPAAFAALAAFGAAEVLLPVSLGFAAGAMVYVVVDEIIPESHLRGNERAATLALVGGFGLMMVLDSALG
jgi:zinc transporter, ZIP family